MKKNLLIIISLIFLNFNIVKADFLGMSIPEIPGGGGGVLNGGIDYNSIYDIFNNPQLNSIWSSYGKYPSGIMDLCYATSLPSLGGIDYDLCSLINVPNPCGPLPDDLGVLKKRSSASLKKQMNALKDWCSRTENKNKPNKPIEEANKQKGISGKSKKEVKDSTFNTPVKTEKEKKVASSIKQYKNTTKAEPNSYAEKVVALEKNGEGHIIRNEIVRLGENSDQLDSKNLDKVKDEIIFKDYEEYQNDLNSKASEDATIEKQLFDFNNHVKTANQQFNSFNLQKKGLSAKMDFIEDYIENESKGIRQSYYKFFEQKTQEEIMYVVPKKLDNTYFVFNEDNLLSNNAYSKNDNKKTQITMINDDIVKQQFLEKEVMLKNRKIADDKANALKSLLIKNAIASEVFDRNAALQNIKNMLN